MPTLSNTLLCKPPIHYEDDRVEIRSTSTPVPEMIDNDYLTHSTEDDVDVNVADADGNATKIDLIGLVTKNVDSYAFTPTGGAGAGFTSRKCPGYA